MSSLIRLLRNPIIGKRPKHFGFLRSYSTVTTNASAKKSVTTTSAIKHEYVPPPITSFAANVASSGALPASQIVRFFTLQQLDVLADSLIQLEQYKKAARDLKVPLEGLTALDYANWHLKKQSEFSRNTELSDRPLNNMEDAIQYSKRKFGILKLVIPETHHDVFNGTEAKILLDSSRKKSNELEFGIEFKEEDADIYDHLKKQILPPLIDFVRKEGITAQDFVDIHGGPNEVLNPLSIKLAPYYERIIDAKSEAERLKFQDLLMVELSKHEGEKPENKGLETLPSSDYTYRNLVYRQSLSMAKVSEALGRDVRFADFDLESRFRAGAVRQTHPFFESNNKIYIYGELDDVSKFDSENSITFKKKEYFNPPSTFKVINPEIISRYPKIVKQSMKVALNFPIFEEDADEPGDGTEALLAFRLWKLNNIIFPELKDDEEKQLLFSEMFDISPGEPTLEWLTSYPPQEHTFNESVLWIHNWEDDDVGEPVEWPPYNPAVLEGLATIENDDDSAKIVFQDVTIDDELRASVHAYLLDRMNKKEYANLSLNDSDLQKNLTPVNILIAKKDWDAMTRRQKDEIIELYSKPEDIENDDGLKSPRVFDELRRLSGEIKKDEFSSSLAYLEDFQNVATGTDEADFIEDRYKKLLALNYDYLSAGGMKNLFSKLGLNIEERLHTLSEMYPAMKEAGEFDTESLLRDMETLKQASKKVKDFFASDRFQELALIESKEQEKKILENNKVQFFDENLEGTILPSGIFYRSKPISELTEEEKVFAVISEFDELSKPVQKIIPNAAIISYATHLFKPLQELQLKMRFANERRFMSALNEIDRPSPSDNNLEIDIENLEAQYKKDAQSNIDVLRSNPPIFGKQKAAVV